MLNLAYVLHDFNRPFDKYEPDAITLQDNGKRTDKGRTIPVRSNWWKYIEKINSPLGYKYARGHGMWINRDYDSDTPYSIAQAESIISGGNFVAYDAETATHLRILSFPNNMDTSKLDPAIYNWRNMPYMFWKACAVKNGSEKVINVGEGLDVYFPIICNEPKFFQPAELWIEKRKVKLLGQEWSFVNGNAYMDGVLHWQTGAVLPRN